MRKMPGQRPSTSRQDYQTPPIFLGALKRRLGISEFTADLAATPGREVARTYYTASEDSLNQCWKFGGDGWAFCNPPFGHIEPWVKKATLETEVKIAMLLPASVGSLWFKNWVFDKAHILFLNGRLTFVGETTPYPKDCMVLLYSPACKNGVEIWSWNKG